MAVLLAEGAEATQQALSHSAASVAGLAAHACACVASAGAQALALSVVANHSLSVLRVASAQEPGFHNDCLRACLSSQPPE